MGPPLGGGPEPGRGGTVRPGPRRLLVDCRRPRPARPFRTVTGNTLPHAAPKNREQAGRIVACDDDRQQLAATTAFEALAGNPTLVVELGEVGGKSAVVKRTAVEPGVRGDRAPRGPPRGAGRFGARPRWGARVSIFTTARSFYKASPGAVRRLGRHPADGNPRRSATRSGVRPRSPPWSSAPPRMRGSSDEFGPRGGPAASRPGLPANGTIHRAASPARDPRREPRARARHYTRPSLLVRQCGRLRVAVRHLHDGRHHAALHHRQG